ncbi:MAG: bifunctional folylpolyglutamate synthase/dihydrofolate synthase, partial [Gammaproteobacteria bacterium]|nr:bifunctional folylpolyglutamate synthase/dihydrofolate synthase [Gammaproteobacteria bacterium]
MSRDLDGWLRYIEQLHPREIDLGLDRPRRVLGALAPGRIAPVVITVAGTNGKGSCCAFLANILQAAGLRTGVYTSPHLQRYNERIAIDGAAVTDDELVRAFERVEQARDTTPLTYFEFGTLAALDLFAAADIDVAVLEVGMGGRLDAVNIVEPDAAIVTSIGIDHVDWLGSDREAIAREKAGVFRRATAAIVGDPDPPQTLLDCATQSGADLRLLGHDFVVESDNGGWQYRSGISCWDELPIPGFGGSEQLRNAACALAALEQLRPQLDLRRAHLVA